MYIVWGPSPILQDWTVEDSEGKDMVWMNEKGREALWVAFLSFPLTSLHLFIYAIVLNILNTEAFRKYWDIFYWVKLIFFLLAGHKNQ